MSDIRHNLPFTAVAAQPQFKLALLLAAVNPLVGGVLISGPRGSAKSTLARGLADILPLRADRPHPFVTLPLGASEEMLIGTLNLQQVLDKQEVTFQPGLLAKADGGVLFVDEVNLLPDNLVDQLLDVAASGVNTVERDGISHQHAAQFILLGTMNPDEGELRPQLIDRFGLSVHLSNEYSLEDRITIVQLREQFDSNKQRFVDEYAAQQQALTVKISQAQALLVDVQCSVACRRLIAERCHAARVEGLRADIVWTQAALSYAALEQRRQVSESDVLAVEALVLGHRRNAPENEPPGSQQSQPQQPFSRPAGAEQQTAQGDWGAMPPQNQKTQAQVSLRLLAPALRPAAARSARKPATEPRASSNVLQGEARGAGRALHRSCKVDWFCSLIANAGVWPLATLRYRRQRRGAAVIHLVILDTSGSILAGQGFAKAKGWVLQVANKAYLRREQFALLGFGNQQVDTLVALRRAPKAVLAVLDTIAAGGGTPLALALHEAAMLQQRQLRKDAAVSFQNYLITDGRISDAEVAVELAGDSVVIDVEQSTVKRGKAQEIASALGAQYGVLTA